MANEQKIEFKPPKLNSKGKRWYVYYSIKDPISKKWEFRREWISTKCKSVKEKRAEAEAIRIALLDLLEGGSHGNELFVMPDLLDALDTSLAWVKSNLRHRTYQSYSQAYSVFKRWVIEKKLQGRKLNEFTRKMAAFFIAQNWQNVSAKTFNTYVIDIRKMFDRAIRLHDLEINPFDRIELKRETEPNIVIWNRQDLEKLFQYLKTNDHSLFMICLLVYRCFLRPKEILELKIKDFQEHNGILMVESGTSKNRKALPVSLPKQLLQLLSQFTAGFDQECLIFSGKELKPGVGGLIRNRLSERFKAAREFLGISSELKLYSLKHTGNSELLDAGVSLEKLMFQNRHSDFRMTQKYAKRISRTADPVFFNLEDV